MVKSLFRGSFMFNRQAFIKYAYANSKDQAKFLMVKQIAKDQQILPVVVFGWLKDHPNSFEIKIEIEYKESENETNG